MAVRPSPSSPAAPSQEISSLAERAVNLAAELLREAGERQTPAERRQRETMSRMMADPQGKAFTIALADQVLRARRPRRAARSLHRLIRHLGVPRYLSPWERSLLTMAALASRAVPGLVIPLITRHIRQESRHVILSAQEDALHRYLDHRRQSGTHVNLNLLGEAVLGEKEAANRLQAILDQLANPRIHYVSVKISSIFSQIHLAAYHHTLTIIKERLRQLYAAAIEHGSPSPKFVNLDMEEYDDLDLTLDAFRSVLDEPPFENLEAGIVLQAYLPDSFALQQQLTDWARRRHARTGAAVKLRLVKGANLAMETVEASLRGWPLAPYASKHQVDANFKRMLDYGCRPEHAAAVRLGVASHNLFDLAYALLLSQDRGLSDRLDFEMLEGMANPQARALQERVPRLVIYAPAVQPQHFESAIAYLVRRLDENTAPNNFLHDIFGLQEGSDAWLQQRDRFLAACHFSQDPSLQQSPNRTQNRLTETHTVAPQSEPFANTADTDFSLQPNRRWSRNIFASVENHPLPPVAPVEDPAEIDRALERCRRAQVAWEKRGISGRAEILNRAAAVMARERGPIISAMIQEGNKALTEADSEVSEAIDFARYYARSLELPGWLDGTTPDALGVVLVTPPWNFPYAIPAGGCLAALMAGNAVVLKPAPETRRIARLLVEQLWEAGVPRDCLHFLPVPDSDLGRRLVTDPRVDAVILTGSMETAQRFCQWRPGLRLLAETSGKNAVIITEAADLDLAIKDLVRSAFSHAGQKCSAASLGILQASVYEDPNFRRQLRDAAESLPVGPATDPWSVVTPLIQPPGEALRRALTTLDPGESWLLEPRQKGCQGRLWTPGIKLGVRPGSWFQQTECFGPVLGLIRVETLAEAIDVQNSTAYGLTGGLHSLDPMEISFWRENVEVGNAYINRGTTGAVVRRQPFGGWKHSAVGPGAKAGGPNYVANFCRWNASASRTDQDASLTQPFSTPLPVPAGQALEKYLAPSLDPVAQETLTRTAHSVTYWWTTEFGRQHDPSALYGESNHFRYRLRKNCLVRFNEHTPQITLLQILLIGQMIGLPVTLSSTQEPRAFSSQDLSHRTQSEEDLITEIAHHHWSLIRLCGPASPRLHLAAAAANVPVIADPVVTNGRVELRHYFLEQTISQTTHRYGNLVPTEGDTDDSLKRPALSLQPPDGSSTPL